MKINAVETIAEFRQLETAWNNLARTQGAHEPWLRWEWFDLYIDYFSKQESLKILTVNEGENIVGIAPCVVERVKHKGNVSSRRIFLMGSMHSPVQNILCKSDNPECAREVVGCVLTYFRKNFTEWDVSDFKMIPEESNISHVMKGALGKAKLAGKEYECKGDWYLNGIDFSFESYEKSMPKKHRNDIRRCNNQLKKQGELSFQVVDVAEDIDGCLDEYSTVRRRSWKSDEKDEDYIRKITKYLAANGWLRIGFLRLNGKPISCEKWVVCNSKGYMWDIIYDNAYSRYSPGKVLTYEMARYAIDKEKIVEMDFGTGDEEYKKKWTPQRRQRKGFTFYNKNLNGRVQAMVFLKMWPLASRSSIVRALVGKVSGSRML